MVETGTTQAGVDEDEAKPLALADLLYEIVLGLVDAPGEVSVLDLTPEAPIASIQIRVAAGDFGKVVGKQGRTITLLRELCQKFEVTMGRKCVIDVFDPRAADRPRR